MNNYNQSSTGDNIELSVSYDSDLARMYYEDFAEENTRLEFGRDSSIFLFGDSSKPMYKKSQLAKMKKAELIELDGNYEILCPYDYNEVTKKELIEELIKVTVKRHYEYLISEYTWNNITDKFAHEYYISRGYSQGDATYIINLWDDELTESTKNYIDHVLWDSPIYISITVNDIELNDDCDLLDDIYEYDTDSIIKKVKLFDISESAKEWIIENLPSVPKYN